MKVHQLERSRRIPRPPGEAATIVRDRVRYALPLGPLGELARRAFVARDLDRIFDDRLASVSKVLA